MEVTFQLKTFITLMKEAFAFSRVRDEVCE